MTKSVGHIGGRLRSKYYSYGALALLISFMINNKTLILVKFMYLYSNEIKQRCLLLIVEKSEISS